MAVPVEWDRLRERDGRGNCRLWLETPVQGCMRVADNRRGGGGGTSWTPPPPWTQISYGGKNEILQKEICIWAGFGLHFWVLDPLPPHLFYYTSAPAPQATPSTTVGCVLWHSGTTGRPGGDFFNLCRRPPGAVWPCPKDPPQLPLPHLFLW